MPRAKALRIMRELPVVKGFRPLWMRPNYRAAVIMALEEYEVIRLVDYEKLTHEQASECMGVSRPTLTRIYEQARHKLATSLIEGRSFLIEGGEVKLTGDRYLCEDCKTRYDEDGTDVSVPCCPNCGSTRIVSLSDCFMRGCRKCTKCT